LPPEPSASESFASELFASGAIASEPFAFGRDADVYALGEDRVVRRYRNGHPVRDEAQYMRHVAQHGYPVPAVYQVDGPDMILERLSGPTLADAARAGEVDPVEVGELHADLHRRLHAIPAPSGTDGSVVVRGDLHPENVILTADGPRVIDWCNAEEGPPEFDVAMTAIIFAQVALDPAFAVLSDLLRKALSTYLANSIDPSPGLAAALAVRGRNRTLTAEELALLPAQEELIRSHLPFTR
jgi:aminoglycoside phosphotransferase (APT) family kinase protein